MVETEIGLKLKRVRFDNGGKYIDGRFKEYCDANRIKMKKTILGISQQNGVVESMNKTINERTKSMRLYYGLPKVFWADAVNTTVYLINRGPSVPFEYRLPKEVWSEKRDKVSSFESFWLHFLCSC